MGLRKGGTRLVSRMTVMTWQPMAQPAWPSSAAHGLLGCLSRGRNQPAEAPSRCLRPPGLWASDAGGSAVQSCPARILPAASLGGPVFQCPEATLDNRTALEGNGWLRPQGGSFVSTATGRSSADRLGQPASPRAAVLSPPAPTSPRCHRRLGLRLLGSWQVASAAVPPHPPLQQS